jgi:protein TonB
VIGREPARARRVAWTTASIGLHLGAVAALLLWPERPRPPPPRVVEVQLAPPRALPPAAAPAAQRSPRLATGRRPARQAKRARVVAPRAIPDAPLPRLAPISEASEASLAGASAERLEFSGAEPGVFGGEAGGAFGASERGSIDGAGGSPWLAGRFREILRRIQRHIDRAPYPPVARAHGWTGLVRVAFLLRTDGTIAALEIRESSGFTPLDRCALEAVRAAVPFPRPPRDEVVIVPIRFELVARG